MSRKFISQETREQVVEEYRDGQTAIGIARRHGLSDTTVLRIARAANAARPTSRPTPEELVYTGGWVRDGLILRPAKTDRRER